VDEPEGGVSDFETLNTEGFTFEALSIKGAGLGANYGDGYGEGVVTGNPAGLLTWKVKISALPDVDEYTVAGPGDVPQTRWEYLWEFYVRHNVANWHKVFWLRDPKSGRHYLADIAEEELSFQLFCLTVASAGLTLRQRRVAGQDSPGDPTDVENPDSI
jgi:hypothetical protein